MVEIPPCCYCSAPWTLGGYAHSRTCFITTGEMTVAAARKAKERCAQQKKAELDAHGFLSEPDEGGLA